MFSSQWIPELELLIVASQKGMVALVRVLRIDLGDGQDEYVFNREAYLPHAQQHASPLYGTSHIVVALILSNLC
jgi:hypothetical protein